MKLKIRTLLSNEFGDKFKWLREVSKDIGTPQEIRRLINLVIQKGEEQ